MSAGEVPERLLQVFKEDLARRAVVQPEAVSVISAVEKQWPDGSLGCGKPGEVYTQMIVPGYLAVLSAAGQHYPYHSDLRGRYVVCVNGVAAPPVSEQTRGKAPQG